MKKLYALFIFCLFSVAAVMAQQQTFYYNFEGNLQEQYGLGPNLTVLGEAGTFENDVLNEVNGNTKMVYFFTKNSGVQFDNKAAGNFIGDNYSIEIYFKFDQLQSWKRVIDWKNRKTDWGAYIYSGQLNFYNILYSGEAPVVAGEYTYYVLTRTASSGVVLIYTDAEVKIDFNDKNGDALVDDDGVINFFHDDLIVQNEASPGAVAMIKLYNYPLTQQQITDKWENIGGQIYGIQQLKKQVYANVYPNPASNVARVDLSHFEADKPVMVKVFNMEGRLITTRQLQNGNDQLGTGFLIPGLYVLHLQQENLYSSVRLLIN
ncbi:hypothetical protein DSECCO2_544870 [anaerobic digester metagenome]|nr:T9SS type A sorting domain-containing protein [Lentimicrobiaceae bacterium]